MASIANSLGIGSGIDVAQMVADLAAAARAPREEAIVKRETANKAQISVLASLKNALDSFATSLQSLATGGSLSSQAVVSDTSILKATVARGASLEGFSGQIEVTRLASAQSLVSAPISDAGAPIGQGDLTLTVGGKSATLKITAANDSMSGLAAAINASDLGVTATILRDGSQSRLVVRGPSGAAGAFTLVPASGAAASLAAYAWDGAAGGMSRVQQAGDAELVLDGVSITRPTNRIDDIFAGVTFDLAKASPGTIVTLSTERPTTAIKQAVYDFAAAYNQLEAALDDATASGLDGTDVGPFRGSSALREMRAQLATSISQALASGDGPKTLSEIGVKTQRDGSLLVDAATLDAAVAAHPDAIERMFSPTIAVDNPLVRITALSGNVKPGTYKLTDLIPASGTTPASGKIDGIPASAEGSVLSARTTTKAAGLSFEVLGTVTSATVTVDLGIAGAMAAIRDFLNGDNGALTATNTRLTDESKSISKDREKMELSSDAYEARLKASFTAMDAQLASLKATQAYLTQQIAMWSNSDD